MVAPELAFPAPSGRTASPGTNGTNLGPSFRIPGLKTLRQQPLSQGTSPRFVYCFLCSQSDSGQSICKRGNQQAPSFGTERPEMKSILYAAATHRAVSITPTAPQQALTNFLHFFTESVPVFTSGESMPFLGITPP